MDIVFFAFSLNSVLIKYPYIKLCSVKSFESLSSQNFHCSNNFFCSSFNDLSNSSSILEQILFSVNALSIACSVASINRFYPFAFPIPIFALIILFFPSNVKDFVTIPTVKIFISFAISAITGLALIH